MALSTTKRFSHKAAPYAAFYNEAGEPRLNVEGTVEIAGVSDIDINAPTIDSSCYIGKSAGTNGGDFVVAWTSATELTLSSFPGAITAIYAADIEAIRQINVAGTVVATYHRDDTTMLMTGAVLAVTGAAFASDDKFIVFTNIPRPASSGAGGAGGGSIVYTNMSGDFVATITNATTNITVTGLPFTLEAGHVVLGSLKKKAVTTNVVTTLLPSTVSVAGGVITLGGVTNFATGDEVYVTLIGPDKAYDLALDSSQGVVQNPEYGHYTGVETLISETNLSTILATADGGGDTDTIVDADGAFSGASTAVGYIGYQTTDSQSATVNSVASATTVETTTLTGGATWASKAYSLPKVMRYEIPMEGYNFLSMHWRLTTVANQTVYVKLYGTLDSTATAEADTNWVDLTSTLLTPGVSTGVSCTGAASVEGIKVLDSPFTMLKYMVKLVVEKSTAGAPSGSLFTMFIKKSS